MKDKSQSQDIQASSSLKKLHFHIVIKFSIESVKDNIINKSSVVAEIRIWFNLYNVKKYSYKNHLSIR